MPQDWGFEKRARNWPLDESGQQEKAVLLTHTLDSGSDTSMVLSLLEAYGIPCFPYYAKEGAVGKVISGFSGFGVDLYVPESRLEEAKGILEAQPVEEDQQ